MCDNGFHCSKHIQDALGYVQGDTLAVVEVRGEHLSQSDKECWSEMRVISIFEFTKEHAVRMAIFSARLCLSVFERAYPDDKRPAEAIDAAEAWVNNPCDGTKSAAYASASAASAAAAAAYAAYAAYASAAAAAAAAYAAASAAASASAARSEAKDQIHEHALHIITRKEEVTE